MFLIQTSPVAAGYASTPSPLTMKALPIMPPPARSLCHPPPPVALHPPIAIHSLQSLARAYALVLSPIPTPISAPLPSLLHPPHVSSRPLVTPFGPATLDSPHVSPSRFLIPLLNSVCSSSYGPASPTVWMMLFCHLFPQSIEYVENPSLLSLSSLVLVDSPRALHRHHRPPTGPTSGYSP